MAAPHARSNSNLGGAASSLGMPSKTNPDGSFRYKAVTREVLLGICKKHFSIKALGPSISGTTRSKQFDPDEFGANIPSIQTRTESLEHYLKRATHLQLDNLKLSHTFPDPDLAAQNGERVPNDNTLSLAKALRVLYLHDNNLTRIDTLSFCANALTHLYLQCNHIARIENVHELVNLEKLYLTGNMIQVLEGFVKAEDEQQQQQQLEQSGENSGDPNDPSSSSHSQSQQPPSQPRPFYLIELHMDSQRLPPGVGLALSIPSIQALSSSLRIMSLVNNAMDSDSILPISLLSKLVNLNLSRNRIDDVALVAEMCSYLPDLTTLDLRENPISSGEGFTAVKMKEYRDRVIMSSRSIQLLDEKVVPDNQRDYLHSLSEQKKLKRKNAAAAKGQPVKLTTSEEKFAVLHRAPAFPYAPKVLTLRTTAGHAPSGSISAAQLGGMGFGKKSAMLREGAGGVSNFAAFPPPHASAAAMSQFADDDPNLGGGGGGFEEYEDSPEVRAQYSRAGSSASSGGVQQQSSSLSASSSQPHLTPAELESLDPIPGLPFTGDPTRLHYLLQTRGLVSALGSTMVSEAAQIVAESARQRRANMNAMNAKPNGWDGGRSTQSRGGTKP